MSDAPVGIVLAHGDLAAALVGAVELITGRGGRLAPLSNRGLGAAEIEELLRATVASTGARVIFTDLPAGSCNFAAFRLLKERGDIIVITGVNLPALLQFATRDDVPPEEAAAAAVERGTATLRLLAGTPRVP